MTVADVLGAVGRFLIGLGLIILAFVAYQLWGTGLAEARAQNGLEDDFADLVASAGAAGVSAEPSGATETDPGEVEEPSTTSAAPQSTTTLPDAAAFETTQRWTPEQLTFFFPEGGEAMARIDIPTTGITKTVVEGVAVEDLRKGPGHYSATSFPGQPGNAAIAGHRTTYGAPFHDLDDLAIDDEVVVTTVQGSFTYLVVSSGEAFPQLEQDLLHAASPNTIVSPSDTWVLADYGDNRLTLTACHPKYSARQRIVVVAVLVDAPAAAAPRPSADAPLEIADPDSGETIVLGQEYADEAANEVTLDEGLGWSTEHLPAAIAWAMIAGAVFIAGWLAARTWRRWPSWAIASVPFIVTLWFCFERVDRVLPAV